MKKIFCLEILALLFSSTSSIRSFNTASKLSTSEVQVGLDENMGQSLVLEGNNIWAVWADALATNESAIFFKMSIDSGLTWSNDLNLSPTGADDSNPLIAVCNMTVHVVWWRNPYNNLNHVGPATINLYKRSLDGGVSWLPEVVIGSSWTFWPGISCSGKNVFINMNNITSAIGSLAISYNTEIFFQASNDNGDSFNPIIQISNALGRSEDPAMAAFGNSVFIAWNDGRDNLSHSKILQMYYRRSLDNGQTWSSETAMSASPNFQCYSPTIAAYQNFVVVAMANNIANNAHNIVVRISSDGGLTFSNWNNITQPLSNTFYPTVGVDSNSTIHIAYGSAYSISSNNNFYTSSYDQGNTWTNPVVLATWPSAPLNANTGVNFIAANGFGNVVVIWPMPISNGGHSALFWTSNFPNGSSIASPSSLITSPHVITTRSTSTGTSASIPSANQTKALANFSFPRKQLVDNCLVLLVVLNIFFISIL